MQQHTAGQHTALLVSQQEDGLKLLRFLERRLKDEQPSSMLHKWIRSGQVRVNGGRCKAFMRLSAGDSVRVPPFAEFRSLEPDTAPSQQSGVALAVLHESDDILVLAKAGGLACQDGSAQDDSLAAQLRRIYAHTAYVPAPAHRLDRHTSGLILAGKSHSAQERLHGLFAAGDVSKDYLAWVMGPWPYVQPYMLEDSLRKQRGIDGLERVSADNTESRDIPLPHEAFDAQRTAREHSSSASGKSARCAVVPVCCCESSCLAKGLSPEAGQSAKQVTLLLVRLLTGRTHQIRVQLASRGHPIIGDGRHGGPRYASMLLHAWSLSFPWPQPEAHSSVSGELSFSCPPPWLDSAMPDSGALRKAQEVLNQSLIDICA